MEDSIDAGVHPAVAELRRKEADKQRTVTASWQDSSRILPTSSHLQQPIFMPAFCALNRLSHHGIPSKPLVVRLRQNRLRLNRPCTCTKRSQAPPTPAEAQDAIVGKRWHGQSRAAPEVDINKLSTMDSAFDPSWLATGGVAAPGGVLRAR